MKKGKMLRRDFLPQGKEKLGSGITQDVPQQERCFSLRLGNACIGKALDALKI